MKIFNKRPIVLFAIVMFSTVMLLLYHNSFLLSASLIVVCSVFAIVGLIVWLVVSNDKLKYIFSRMFIISLAMLMSCTSVFVREKLYLRDYDSFSGYATICGRVSDVGDLYNGTKRAVILDNVQVVEDDGESKTLNGNLKLVVICDGSEDIFEVGYWWAANAKISYCTMYYVGDYGLSFTYAAKNITCSGYVMQANISCTSDSLDLKAKDVVKNKVKDILESNLDEEFAGLGLGMLFGDSDALDDEIKSDFSATGIAHLLAVSGLHVGFLFAILSFICNLFKIKGLPRCLLISALLIFYAYLCGFTVSVVRATIMCICSLLAIYRQQRYDVLNSLALSLILIGIINPLDFTTIGFRLSYLAVLSIILLSRPISKVFEHVFKPKFANTIGTLLAVQIGTCGILISAFNNITIVSIVANFVCIPVASFAYMILFVTLLVSLILPFLSITIYLFQFVAQIIVKFVHLLAKVAALPLASWKGTVETCLCIAGMYLTSNYIFLNKIVKWVAAGIVWVAAIVLLIV